MGAAETQHWKIHHGHLKVSLALQKGVAWVFGCYPVGIRHRCWSDMNPGSYSIHFNGGLGGQQHQEQPSPLCFQVFSTMSLNIYPISNLVLVWNFWGICITQDTKFRPQFLMGDLESLQSSHKILVSLQSHSEGIKSGGQGSGSPIQDLKRGQVKMVGGIPGS